MLAGRGGRAPDCIIVEKQKLLHCRACPPVPHFRVDCPLYCGSRTHHGGAQNDCIVWSLFLDSLRSLPDSRVLLELSLQLNLDAIAGNSHLVVLRLRFASGMDEAESCNGLIIHGVSSHVSGHVYRYGVFK